MAESSLFAQRLKAITERRRLQERILATRRDLEEERLRAERLKRKSLRDRWLMEGTSAPTDDNDHTSPFWEAQTRIQELEQDLSSLQSQMQQLDNPELHRAQQRMEEVAGTLKEVKQSLDSIGKVDGTSSSSPEGKNSSESRLELAPLPPKRPMRAAAKEKLQNGDMGEGPFSGEFSPEKASVKMIPVVAEGGDLPPPWGSSEVAPATKPAWQSVEPSEAPTSRQRKLAVEEMVIRDHLGQEVGSMDAVGQKQRSIGKEDEEEDHTDLGNGCEDWSKPGPLCSTLGQEKTPEATESQLDSELGSRDGPEGQSPTSQNQQSPSRSLQNENCYLDSPKRQAEGGLEMGSLAKEAALVAVGQKELPEQGAKEAEPTQDLATGDAPAAESVRWEEDGQMKKQELQEPHGLQPPVTGPGEERGESWLGQSTPLLPAQIILVQGTKAQSSLEEAKTTFLDPVLSSSLPDQNPLTLPDQIISLQDTKGSLLDQIPSSFQEIEGSLLDPVLPFLPHRILLEQNLPLQENKESSPGQISSSFQESLSDQNPPSQLEHISSSSEQKPSSLQGEIAPEQEAKLPLLDQIPSSLHEANGKPLDQIPTSLQDQSVSLPDEIQSLLPDQSATLLEVESTLPEQIPSSLPEIERSLQISTALQGQELSVQETEGTLSDLTPSLTNQLSSLPDKITSLQEAEGGSSFEEIPLVLQDQMPTPSEAPILSPPEAGIVLPGQIPSSVDEAKHLLPNEMPVSVPDQIPPAPQDQKLTCLEDKTPSSLQEAGGSLPDQGQALLPSPTSPGLPVAKGASPNQTQPTFVEQMPTSPQGQVSSLPAAEGSLPEEQVLSSVPEQTPTVPDQAPSPNQFQSPTLQDVATVPDVVPLSSQEPVQPPPNVAAAVENQGLKEGGDASRAVAVATAPEEIPEVLGNLHAEQQPLLKEAKATADLPDTSIRGPQTKAGILKAQGATSQEAPTYTTTSANTASSCQLQPAVPRQGEGQEQGQSRRKQKSCQCCSIM
ncbi:paralemmin-3 [Hemicordylus capensis]|uniref:paralemmin-3 n=1 Tax=Hemicordylus capensis TaxID=884348 RepID=UPI00230334F0|nr:paralemmin-3 [Hemicordylus capensis]